MAIVDLFVKSGSSPRLSADDATVQHQMALLLHGDYTKWAWLFSDTESGYWMKSDKFYHDRPLLSWERNLRQNRQ